MSSREGKNVTFESRTFVEILNSSLTKASNKVIKRFTLDVFECRWLSNAMTGLNHC
jgi:hypothetical protein